MEGQSLWQEICAKRRELSDEITKLVESGAQLSRNEASYRVALSKYIIGARAAGVPVTVISDMARGQEDISQLRLQRDMSEVLYKAAQERINAIKLELRILQSQWEREWSRPDGS